MIIHTSLRAPNINLFKHIINDHSSNKNFNAEKKVNIQYQNIVGTLQFCLAGICFNIFYCTNCSNNVSCVFSDSNGDVISTFCFFLECILLMMNFSSPVLQLQVNIHEKNPIYFLSGIQSKGSIPLY